ncbi:hypothetical protein [Flavobacterium sedimenticola]|uniref:Holin n=1 Tax=Flavobacterium sedimenticola TaxID=3043286 RepID=A0ABT6XMJ0_9FLAO|nr:hypothetical protein [Flavobacterium sedimenticola]MDI9256313.1 hypothetical protein [Flavobacterium sedimenticola]
MKLLELLNQLGIETPSFIAGMSGAIAFITKRKDMNWTTRFLTVLSGGFTANYLTPITGEWLSLNEKALYGIAFLLGYSGMKSVEVILSRFTKQLHKSDNEKPQQ